MKSGIELIADEIKRAIEVEGWKDTSDSETYGDGQMLGASACYLMEALRRMNGGTKFHAFMEEENHGGDVSFVDIFPWGEEYDKRKKHSVIKLLTIAGAWVAREIDRIRAIEPNEELPK